MSSLLLLVASHRRQVFGSFFYRAFAEPRCAHFQSASTSSFLEYNHGALHPWRNVTGRVIPPTRHKKQIFVLPMFPYPSGSLHMGHVRVYTISDVLTRYHRMRQFNVLHPMGWDAFGLPAENAAIERGISPDAWTKENIYKMKEQLMNMSVDFDWDREFMTCSPAFYKHTQKLFLMLLKRGLAYQAEALVNWDPVDKTVLANEQVDSDGCSWRSGAAVERIWLKQWFFRITKYQHALLHDLDPLGTQKQWPERVLTQQRNWIGHSTGAKIKFEVFADGSPSGMIEVYTTRPDTLFGVQYLALSTSHPLVRNLARRLPSLQKFLNHALTLPPDSKEGYLLPGLAAMNPLNHTVPNGGQEKQLPVYTAPYVLSGCGEGAVMGVPGHDSTDLAFWRQQTSADSVPLVISPSHNHSPSEPDMLIPAASAAFLTPGVLNARCGRYSGLSSTEGGRQIVENLAHHEEHAAFTEKWRLRDWLISRQRYWGTPIPIIHCRNCGAVPVPEHLLPVKLPMLDESIKGKTGNPLDEVTSWVNTTCPNCHQPAKRETDTMDTFVDSSWYFMRFPDAGNDKELVSQEAAASLLPVDIYIGGIEHAILHLLYARFIYKFLIGEGLVPHVGSSDSSASEPFRRVISQGMVHGKTFSDPATGQFLHPSKIEGATTQAPIIKASGKVPVITFEKMSKSKYNGVDPSACIAKYGADATRAHILFSAPVGEVLEWDEEKIVGIQRWFGRISKLVSFCGSSNATATVSASGLLDGLVLAEQTPFQAEQVGTLLSPKFHAPKDLETLLFVTKSTSVVNTTFSHNIYALNTAVSDLIKLTNKILDDLSSTSPDMTLWSTSALLRMLAPIAPTFAQEKWKTLQENPSVLTSFNSHWPGSSESIFRAPFPSAPLSSEAGTLLSQQQPSIQCGVQINGKLRFNVTIPNTTTRSGTRDARGGNEEEGGGGEEVEGRIKGDKNGAATTQRQTDTEKEKQRLIDHLLQTPEARFWLTQKNDWAKRRKVIVVNRSDGSRVVNVVFPKS